MKKRLFALLLVLVLALSLMSMAALADETEPAEQSMVEKSVEEPAEESENELADTPSAQAEPIVEAEPVMLDAAAGGTELTQDSVDSTGTLALEDGKTYQLVGTVAISAPISITGTVTLDLNGNTLKTTGNGPVIRVGTGDTVGDLTIRDSGSNGQIIGASVSDTSSAGCIRVAADSKLTLQSGTITGGTAGGTNSAGGVYVASGAMDMTGGEIWYCNMYIRNASEYKSGSYTAAGGVYNKGQLNISGGTVQFCNLVNDTGERLGVMTGAAGGIQNAGTFTMTGSSQLVSNTFYIVSGTDTTTIIDSSLSNAGTMNANGGTVYGLINTGTIQTSGAKETVFDLLTPF